jgi:hypothetical protein
VDVAKAPFAQVVKLGAGVQVGHVSLTSARA